jgi:hypothetical protein
VATRRTTALVAVAVLGCVLVPAGILLVIDGERSGHTGRTVGGILLALAGLVCWRVLSWARRIRLMTDAGLISQAPEHRDHGPDP